MGTPCSLPPCEPVCASTLTVSCHGSRPRAFLWSHGWQITHLERFFSTTVSLSFYTGLLAPSDSCLCLLHSFTRMELLANRHGMDLDRLSISFLLSHGHCRRPLLSLQLLQRCPALILTVMDMPRPSSGPLWSCIFRTSPTPCRLFNAIRSCWKKVYCAARVWKSNYYCVLSQMNRTNSQGLSLACGGIHWLINLWSAQSGSSLANRTAIDQSSKPWEQHPSLVFHTCII